EAVLRGWETAGPQPSGAETIQKLCDRVASSTLLDDRRDAVRALKSLSKASVNKCVFWTYVYVVK
uniref:Uncharacterized protein n=1 Tax=Anser cygnoides TaxID=8845 RepID=A0A8B9EA77_ANSCY